MNRVLNYLNDVLISLDIPPIVKQEPKKERRIKTTTKSQLPLQNNE